MEGANGEATAAAEQTRLLWDSNIFIGIIGNVLCFVSFLLYKRPCTVFICVFLKNTAKLHMFLDVHNALCKFHNADINVLWQRCLNRGASFYSYKIQIIHDVVAVRVPHSEGFVQRQRVVNVFNC